MEQLLRRSELGSSADDLPGGGRPASAGGSGGRTLPGDDYSRSRHGTARGRGAPSALGSGDSSGDPQGFPGRRSNSKFLDEAPDAMEVEEKEKGGGGGGEREGGRGLGALISSAFRAEGRGGGGPGGAGGEDSLEARPLLGRSQSSGRVRVSLATCS